MFSQLSSFVAADPTTAPKNPNTTTSLIGTILMWVAIIAVMYFLMIRPQRKKQKEEQKMRNDLRVGDTVVTIGGITGRVVSVKEDTMVIETGADRTKMTFKKWALQTNETVHDAPIETDDDDDDDDDDI